MIALTAFLPLLLSLAGVRAWSSDNHTCALSAPVYSCENTTAIVDTCCVPTEGLVLVTQFWSTYTGNEESGSVLPKKSWTIHGLWPDRCDGSYGQYCDLTRQYDPEPSPNTTTGKPEGQVVPVWHGGDVITPLLQKLGKWDLLAYMTKYWKAQNQADWIFWQHEFSKHATCFSTYDVGANGSPDCYGSQYVNSTEASIVDFLESTIQAQVQYPTYDWLAEAGVKPSNKTNYPLSQLQGILTNASGAVPYLGCSGKTKDVLSEVWYYSHSLGRPQNGVFRPLDQTTKSNCNTTSGVWYYERTKGSEKH
ncbi:ribonuclease T2 [Papiliotrema laurentii]|uniref:ribonuclease T2 n=1 Tax=Papiliotrema laurentii TaxID=5418 RepID=A0AAD9FLW7_PAPLA|nr:ribonuclease T2 [Papiliotrema laurentii]